MAVNEPIWSYGKVGLFKSSGPTVAADDDIWCYGKNLILHELSAAAGSPSEYTAEGSLTQSGSIDRDLNLFRTIEGAL